MARVRACDVCGELVPPKRKIVKFLEIDDDKDSPRDARVYASLDMHDTCLKKVTDFIKELKEGKK